ncbi:MAG: S41 family peptidase [Bacteroidota bacterium]
MTNISSSFLSFSTRSTTCLFLMAALLWSCSSKAQYTITFQVDTKHITPQNITIRGSVSPLSWDKDYRLTDEDGDGIYTATISFKTSDRSVQFRFVNEGETELQGSDARRIFFKDEPITKTYIFNEFDYYTAKDLEQLTYTPEQIKEDVAVLGEVATYLHPYIYGYLDSIAFQTKLAQLEADLLAEPTLVNAYKEISKFAAYIKCSHTFTNPWNQNKTIKKAIFFTPDKIPFTFQRVGKRLFIDKNASDNERLTSGLEIKSINGVATDSILSTLAQYVTSDGSNYEKKLERVSLSGVEKFPLFDIFHSIVFGSATEFELALTNHSTGEAFIETVKATSKTNRTKVLLERYGDLETSLRDGWKFKLLNEEIGRLTIRSFAVQRNEFDWKEIIDNAFDELNIKQVPNLIIDIRGNEGGQSEVGEYILERVVQAPITSPAMQSSVRYLTIPDAYQQHISTWAKFPYNFTKKVARQRADGSYLLKSRYALPAKTYRPKRNGYKGKVYLLTDASNSSATHLMATYAKHMDNVTLVGQETGGNQLGTNGSFIFFLRLPNTGVEVDIPAIHMVVPPLEGQARDGGIEPDVVVRRNWEDVISGTDSELERVLAMIDEQ